MKRVTLIIDRTIKFAIHKGKGRTTVLSPFLAVMAGVSFDKIYLLDFPESDAEKDWFDQCVITRLQPRGAVWVRSVDKVNMNKITMGKFGGELKPWEVLLDESKN